MAKSGANSSKSSRTNTPRFSNSLDRLESVDGADPENPDALYRRLRCAVLAGDEAENEIVEAWVYFGREAVARRGCWLAGGDWIGRFKPFQR